MRICFQAHSACQQNSFVCGYMIRAQLLAGCWLGFVLNSSHVVLLSGHLNTQQRTFSKPAREKSLVQVCYQDGILWAERVAEAVEHWPHKCETLSSNSSKQPPMQKKKKGNKMTGMTTYYDCLWSKVTLTLKEGGDYISMNMRLL
jgi:hypothetical protein